MIESENVSLRGDDQRDPMHDDVEVYYMDCCVCKLPNIQVPDLFAGGVVDWVCKDCIEKYMLPGETMPELLERLREEKVII